MQEGRGNGERWRKFDELEQVEEVRKKVSGEWSKKKEVGKRWRKV